MSLIAYSINDNNDDLVRGFDAYNCWGDSVYDIFENKYKIITEDYTVWVNTNIKF